MIKLGIKQKLITTFLVMSIVPIMLIGGFATAESSKTIRDEVSFYSEKVVALMGKNVDLMVQQIEKEFIDIMGNTTVVNNVEAHGKGNMEYGNATKVKDALKVILNSSNYIKSAMIITPSGQLTEGNFKAAANFKWDKLEEDGILQRVCDTDSPQWINGHYDEENLLVFRKLNKPSTGKLVGVVVFKVQGADIQKQIDELQLAGEGAAIYLIDENHKLLVAADKGNVDKPIQEVYPALFDETEDYLFQTPNTPVTTKENFVMYTPCNDDKWTVVMTNSLEQMLSEVRNVQYIIVIISLGIVVIAIIVAFYISGGVAKPIQAIVKCMQQAEEGNLMVHMAVKGDKEIQLLSQSFNHMMTNIRELIGQTTEVVEQVRHNAMDVESMALGTKETSIQVSAAVQEIASGASNQANEVESSMVQMQRLAQTINEVMEKMTEIDRVTEKTTTISSAATHTIQELNDQTSASRKITKDIEQDIQKLDKNAEHIIEVVHLIEGISEQTNLLSLNAAIEAARAGAAGKGFGVVADEVRKLAIQSKDATMKIRSIVESIQLQTKQTVEGTKKATEVFEVQRQVVDKTNKAFSDIILAMSSVSTQMQNIHEAIGEMGASKEVAIESMGCIQTIVQEVVALTEELLSESTEQIEAADRMNDSSKQLALNVDTLQKSVQEFVVE